MERKLLKKISNELKKEIVGEHEHCIHMSGLASEYKMVMLTVFSILKNKDAIKRADVAKGVMT